MAMTSFVLLLKAIGTPWGIIILIAHIECRGVYDTEALQTHNRSAVGGRYWFNAGWNIQATTAWILGALAGLSAVSTEMYEGPLMYLTGGVDCSFILSGLAAGIVYVFFA